LRELNARLNDYMYLQLHIAIQNIQRLQKTYRKSTCPNTVSELESDEFGQ